MESEHKDGLLSRRQLLVAVGVTGAAAATTGFLGLGVTDAVAKSVYGPPDAPSASDTENCCAWRTPLEAYGAVGDGETDDTTAVNAALAAGVPLSGAKRVYAVTGKISLPTGADLEDAEFKQLAPGASLDVITLEASGVNSVRLVRVKVNRNGDGTNGGLLDGSLGNNGALDNAYGIRINGGTGHFLQDIEVYGSDSGSLIGLIGLDSTSRVIRPYARDAYWSRSATTATDDQIQGIYVYQCSDLIIDDARVERLTGIQTGVPTSRFTRAIPVGASTALTIRNPYVYKCDQGVDITGGAGNRYIRVEKALLREVYTWTVKLANSAQYCVVSECVAMNCGAAFVANANPALPADIRTSDNLFIDCYNINCGYTGQTVIDADAFKVIHTDTARIKFVRCHAYDFQTVKTMRYAFASHPTGANSSLMQDCDYSGYTTSTPIGGTFVHPEISTGTGSNGRYTMFPDGTLICEHQIDISSTAMTTARGSVFGTSSALTWTFPMAFASGNPVVTATFSRNDLTVIGGCSELQCSTTTWTYHPWSSSSLGAGNVKSIRVVAKGRWKS
ncbi:hypothetical protein PV433_04015 [Paenibacillus sp. GYB004]|uniref:hypothetical protein n=1 Tax=Paenibacillus sp. GYB004 TaxID=2994393 RepID=UPI002F96D772